MTLEELKETAHAMGYNLVLKKPYIPLKACPCGAKRSLTCDYVFDTFTKKSRQAYMCRKCGLRGVYGATNRFAREFWNETVRKKSLELEEQKKQETPNTTWKCQELVNEDVWWR